METMHRGKVIPVQTAFIVSSKKKIGKNVSLVAENRIEASGAGFVTRTAELSTLFHARNAEAKMLGRATPYVVTSRVIDKNKAFVVFCFNRFLMTHTLE